VKEVEMGGAYSTYGENKNAYIILLASPKEKSLGKRKSKWKNNIKMDLK
jgi:hypothetical protein